jgi:osmotically-inducible protein OsmY
LPQLRIFRLFAVLVLAAMLSACAGEASRPAGRTAADDFVLNVQVKHAIYGDLAFKRALLEISTRAGVVQLAGRVGREADVAHATRIAGAVPGVLAVRNDISVGQP